MLNEQRHNRYAVTGIDLPMRSDRTNPDSRNFGLQSRDMARAGLNALREGMQSGQSIESMSQRFSQFAVFAKNELNIRDMRHLEQQHVQQYADHLRDRYDRGEISPSTAQNALSAVNRTLEIARGDRALHVAPVRDAGLPERSGVASESRAMTPEQHQQAIQAVGDRLGAQIELQRELGLRYEESAKINAVVALREAERHGRVTVCEGTKGGRDREVPIVRSEQIEALRAAAEIQRESGHRSMIPPDQSYREYQRECYRVTPEGFRFHGERHSYAQDRYQELTGVACPVAAGIEHGTHHDYIADQLGVSRAEAREIDHAAREQVAEELGHGRIGITNSYLG